ncbi:MAG: acyl-CoA dehydratase activase-related protein [Eubacteriales bacterium]|nr:acyl-CoA dehydratase activase-related protein [Eubacteriales bacterium]
MKLGIDVGSTTVKLVLMDDRDNVVYSKYERHMSDVFAKVKQMVSDMYDEVGDVELTAVITGSGGLSFAKLIGVHFEQEVVTCSKAVETIIPQTDVVIELGGEDAKITFYGATVEQRMNGTCAGGTGAFIDQMAVLLNTDAQGLNEAAKHHKIIYPIAARCGVFAKTDIQPLINDGADKADLAASIFQAVVNQTISGLACGHVIKGNVAFLGGPLTFLSELRKRFIETLGLKPENVIFPDNSKYFVAIGAAMLSVKQEKNSLRDLKDRIDNADPRDMAEAKRIAPLFKDEAEYEKFRARHDAAKVERRDLKKARGKVYLGIDAGSTTTKAVLMDSDKRLLYSFYRGNEGNPVEAVKQMLNELYEQLPADAVIANTCVTGYGESLIKAAFRADMGEIETIAHYKAAEEFRPGVDFILDIGGQDMKCMRIKDGSIYNIMLNEACSAGCGSFLETYAKSVNLDTKAFAEEALYSREPVDLGTRCTVFMNSKVKAAQKEGATVGDISAGLSYSVIKNALYKVIKLRNPEETGDEIVVQGGTFMNDAVLRAIELILGKNVIRPDIAGLMGAYGCALIAQENYVEGTESSVLNKEELAEFHMEHSNGRCKRCENQCILTINKFSDGSRFVTGNRCEKGAGGTIKKNDLPDLYDYKYKRLFDYYKPLSDFDARRGTVAIPRVLNMYEDYPFWFTFFTDLGFRVQLSPASNKHMYSSGLETISSDTACYPAKLVHGHIKWLVDHGYKLIFYPCINFEQVEDKTAQNHYNCPVVSSYPEVIANNMDDLFEENMVRFVHPFLPYDDDERLIKEISRILKQYHITQDEVTEAVTKARAEQIKFKNDIRKQGEYALKYARDHHKKAIVLAGRPYHLDPEINHGMNKMINSFDFVVLTEDSVAPMANLTRDIRVLDQWVFHSRLYKAAAFVGDHDDVELIQLNSFGCGLDAVTTDQVEEICEANNKLYTVLKIDEVSNLGSAKIRVRSLKAAVEERDKNGIKATPTHESYKRAVFTKEMKKDYTLLIPQMSPIHFNYLKEVLLKEGYNAVLLPPVTKNSVDEGLKYINNDACYPTIVTLGQIISALKSGEYDLNKTGVFMSQTGGGCRASNYISLLRKALKDLGMEQVPVISFNTAGLEKNPGFKITARMGLGLAVGAIYGDLAMRLLYATRPYEKNKDETQKVLDSWYDRIVENELHFNRKRFAENVKGMVEDFDKIERTGEVKPKVGVVGEILVKYHPNANNNIVDTIEAEGGEAVVLDMVDFFLYGMYNKKFNYEHLSGKWSSYKVNEAAINLVEWMRGPMRKALDASEHYSSPARIEQTAEGASKILSIGNQCGEGWLLTGEMVELINHGVENIVCLQPFACLPNHVTGKGMMKAIRKMNPMANIVAIDYDPGASDVNQLNRIKLMMATAHKNLEKREAEKAAGECDENAADA